MDVLQFDVLEGKTIKGQIDPRLEGVNVTLTYNEEPETDEFFKVVQLVSDSKGRFSFGPLFPTVKFEAQVEKRGYYFDEPICNQDTHTISVVAHKLAKISIFVELGKRQDRSDVLLSLTGPDQFRSNVQTGEDGKWTFYDLQSGQYYLRPFIKEWSFNPPTITINLEDGGEKVVRFVGTRTQYSAYGTVKTISGLSLPDVVAQAENQETGMVETAVSNGDGEFRIKGLNVDNEYAIKLQLKDDLERFAPDVFKVKMMNADIGDINFTVVHYPANPALTGIVDTSQISNFKIQVSKIGDDGEIESIKLFEIEYSKWFEITGLKRGRYRVELKCDLNVQQFVCDSNSFVVEFDGKKDLFVGRLTGEVRERIVEGEVGESRIQIILGSIVVAGGVMAILVFILWDSLRQQQQKEVEVKKESQWLPAKAVRDLSRKKAE
eukprot:TRINITY_DN2352_c0_g1_i1.p1 TRINITY_DN2352_c0_g1~~TRINITY_DN2352_c0_g1_i1.p1  ORF type:complete len:453 (-),score=88.79 TRINITY_DN2352_c0_g1_i1:890-2194(-)